MSGKAVAAKAWIWFDTTVNLCMSLQVVLAYKTLLAVRALELTIAEMGLDMRLDIFFATKALVAVLVETKPFAITWIRTGDEVGDVIDGNTRFSDGLLKIDAADRIGPLGVLRDIIQAIHAT